MRIDLMLETILTVAAMLLTTPPPASPSPAPAKLAQASTPPKKTGDKPKPPPKVAAKTPKVDAVVARVQKFYDDTKDFEAEFIQTYTRVALSKTTESRGTVRIKKPGMMRWDYFKPAPKQFIVDGKQLWVYEPEDEVVTVQKSFNASQLTTSLSFLIGDGKLRDSFNVKLLEPTEKGTERLELTPKKDATYRKLELTISPSGQVIESTLHETAGNTNRFRFAGMKTNIGIPAKVFSFTPPPNAEVNVVP